MTALARRVAPVLNLLFPARCLGCNAIGSFFCGGCIAAVRPVYEAYCPRCGLCVDIQAPICHCKAPALSCVVAAAEYLDPLRLAIHQFKYKGQRAAADTLAALLAPRLAALRTKHTCLVPVPLHRKRERSRGYNQSTLLARALSLSTGIDLQERVLSRTRHTVHQVELPREKRERNVEGAFEVRGSLTASRHYVLIDDVCTTGATLTAAARALQLAGATRIVGAVVAAATPAHAR